MRHTLDDAKKVYLQFMHAFLVQKDIEQILSFVTDDALMLGIGKNAVSKNKTELSAGLSNAFAQDNTIYTVTHQSIDIIPCGLQGAIVYSIINIQPQSTDDVNTIILPLRSTVALCIDQDIFKVCSLNISINYELQDEDTLFPFNYSEYSIGQLKTFAVLAENIALGFMITQTHSVSCVQYVNKELLSYFGYSYDEFMYLSRQDIYFFIHPEDKKSVQHLVTKVCVTNSSIKFESRAVCQAGNIIWINTRINCFKEPSGKIICLHAIQDITMDKLLRDKLHFSEERFRIAFSQTKNIIFDYNIFNRTISFSDSRPILFFPKMATNENTVIKISLFDFMRQLNLSKEHSNNMLQMFKKLNHNNNSSCTILLTLINGQKSWYHFSLTNIVDEQGEPIRAIGIIEDVTEQKEKEYAYEQEKQYRNAMLAQAMNVYEFNITKNQIISDISHLSGIAPPTKDTIIPYEPTVLYISEKIIHSEDYAAFTNICLRQNLIDNYNQGKTELYVEYRRLTPTGQYKWIGSTTHLLPDPRTGDILSFTYVKDIDQQKRQELSLLYQAERDMLTELYNKRTAERLISTYLERQASDKASENAIHAFMIIDLDNFKSINDRLGHVFGDVVLSDLGRNLQKAFRQTDILGRIGGDEFIAFIKNIPNINFCTHKANEVCEMVHSTYKQSPEMDFSCTIGIALYPHHGQTFLDLYKNADAALYFAKNMGKDRCYMYDSTIDNQPEPEQCPIETPDKRAAKGFEQNISDYIFKLLYHCTDLTSTVEYILKLICLHYDFNHAYIFEVEGDDLLCVKTFEWSDAMVISSNVTIKDSYYAEHNYLERFAENGIYMVNTQSEISNDEYALLEAQSIKTTLQYALQPQGEFHGFIGFDDYRTSRELSIHELQNIQTVTEILAIFLIRQSISYTLQRFQDG